MARRGAIGLDIGSSAVRAAQLSDGRGGLTLERFGEVPLPPGAVRDGEVVEPDTVGSAIKRLWSEARIDGDHATIGVANQKVVVRMVDLPWMPLDELRPSLPYQVQDYVPMPVDSAVLDFHPVEEGQSDTGARLVRGLLVAASHEMVMSAVSAVRGAGVTPVTIDLDPFAVLRAVATPDDLGMGSDVEALVDVGARITNVVVHQGGVPRFVRILVMGADDIVESVAERAGVDSAQALELTTRYGLTAPAASGAAAPPSTPPVPDDPVARAVESAAVQLLDEVRGSLDYFVASSGSAPVTRTVLTGGGGRITGLPERLQAVTRTHVERGDPLSGLRVGKVRMSPEDLERVAPAAAVSVGLALRMAA